MTTNEINTLVNNSYVCMAKRTKELVNKMTLGTDCKDIDFQCLYLFILDLYIISKWNQYPDGTTDSSITNCITQDQFNRILEDLKKKVVGCGLSTNTGITLDNNYNVLDFLQDNFNYIGAN